MRYAWITFGFVNLALGAAGVVLPLLPATPFLLLAAWSFAKSSDRFHTWLVEHPRLGPPIEAWRSRGAISRNAKLAAMGSLALSIAVALLLGASATVLSLQLVAAVGVSTFILTRPAA